MHILSDRDISILKDIITERESNKNLKGFRDVLKSIPPKVKVKIVLNCNSVFSASEFPEICTGKVTEVGQDYLKIIERISGENIEIIVPFHSIAEVQIGV